MFPLLDKDTVSLEYDPYLPPRYRRVVMHARRQACTFDALIMRQ
jgi:hypothetical protein